MMTIKIVTEETDGGERVHLFPAARVEYRVTDLNHPNSPVPGIPQMPFTTFGEYMRIQNPMYTISGLQNLDVGRNMQMAWIYLHDGDGGISPALVSAPATCYIMSDGKTIDRFKLDFLE